VFGRTTFDLTGTRDTRYSYQDVQPYYLITGARLNVTQRLFGPLDLLGGADWEHLSYRWHRDVERNPGALDASNTITDLSAGFAVNLGHNFRISASVYAGFQAEFPPHPSPKLGNSRILRT
jgi:hypothetical protein